MASCLSAGGPVLCAFSSLAGAIALMLDAVTVTPSQCWLLWLRFKSSARKWRTGKAVIFYAILLENIVTLVHCIMIGTSSAITHLLKDYSQFLLFTSVFYYFTLHTFQIMGDSRIAQWAVWLAALMNILYLSGFTAYDAYVIVHKKTTHFCKNPLWLSMRASACFVSLLLVGVGLFASHYLNKRNERISKQRERKLWLVIFMMVVATFIQLAYDIYQETVLPNSLCIGLLPERFEAANAVVWFVDKVICTFSVDFCCLFALWRKQKKELPLLASVDSEDPAIASISNKPLKSSLGSESCLSMDEEDKAHQMTLTRLDDINCPLLDFCQIRRQINMPKEHTWLYHIFASLSAFGLHYRSVDRLVEGSGKLEELQQRYPEKSLSELRELMSPYLQKPPLRSRIKSKIERVKQKISSSNFTRKKDKYTFTIGLLRILAEFYLLGRAPCYYPLCHTFWAAILFSARIIYYRILRYHYFLFDFCYYANSFLLLFLWVWRDSEWFFAVTWAYSVGPLLFAVPLYNNMIVLQHIDKTTSNFLHFSPALTLWAIRWSDCSDFRVAATTPSFMSFYFPSMGLYLLWAVLYYLIIFVITFKRCQAKHNLTLYAWMMEDSKSLPYRWSGAFGEALRPLIFMIGHLVVFSVGIIVSYIAMISFWMNTALLMWIGVISVWNAASYYMEYFAKDYEKKLAELNELNKQQ